MNIKDIVAHIMINIPKHTAEFCDYISFSQASITSNRFVDVVATNHGLTAGKTVVALNGDVKNMIAGINIVGDSAIITLADEHDFVLTDETVEIELGGFAESSWNGKHELLNVPSRLMLEIESPAESPPILSPSDFPHVWESRSMGANGLLEVVAVLADGFRLSIPATHPDMPNNAMRNLELISGFRVAGVADEQRSLDVWNETNQNASWLFVMFPNDEVSKSNEAESDAVATFAPGDDGRLRILENIEISVIIPTKKTGGADAVYKANGEIRRALISTLFGLKADEPGRDRTFGAVYNGSIQSVYNSAVYIRIYSFQVPYDITFENADISNPQSVAFRDILLSMAITENINATTFDANINLDENNES